MKISIYLENKPVIRYNYRDIFRFGVHLHFHLEYEDDESNAMNPMPNGFRCRRYKMAKDCSFDVVSEVDMQEVDNAVNQAKKEIGTRYDFRGSKAEISLEGDTIKIIGDDEYKLNAIIDVLKGKMVKRNVAIKNLDYGKVEPAAGATVRQIITIKKGITKENAKEVVKAIKNMKIKVQASIQEDQVRVSGKDKDDLQAVIQMLKQLDIPVELQFVNFRS